MPPRYAYWTILVDDQPTAFRAGAKEDLLPTFNRLKAKNASATMMWFQNGKLWPSRLDAQEAMIARGEMGRRGDDRQAGRSSFGDRGGFRDRKPAGRRSAWSPRGEPSIPAPSRNADDKLDWKPKGEFVPAPKRADRPDRKPKSDWTPKPRAEKSDWAPKTARSEKPEWKPKGSFDRDGKSDWKPKSPGYAKPPTDRESRPRSFARPAYKPSGDDTRSAKPEWKPKGSFDRKTEWKPKGSFDRDRKPDWKPKSFGDRDRKSDWKPKPRSAGSGSPAGERKGPRERLEWAPKSEAAGSKSAEKRAWVPKADYKKSLGIEAKKDKNWRPGGDHKDPKQKYKDAKKAKWTKFKKAIRTKWEAKGKKKGDD